MQIHLFSRDNKYRNVFVPRKGSHVEEKVKCSLPGAEEVYFESRGGALGATKIRSELKSGLGVHCM
jgi:hypothetical protein